MSITTTFPCTLHHYFLGREKLPSWVKVAGGQYIFLEGFVCFFGISCNHNTTCLMTKALQDARKQDLTQKRSQLFQLFFCSKRITPRISFSITIILKVFIFYPFCRMYCWNPQLLLDPHPILWLKSHCGITNLVHYLAPLGCYFRRMFLKSGNCFHQTLA